MQCKLDGTNVKSLLEKSNDAGLKRKQRRQRRQQSCTCPELSPKPDVLVLDQTRPNDPEIFLVEDGTGAIWAMDLAGCQCRKVVGPEADAGIGKMLYRVSIVGRQHLEDKTSANLPTIVCLSCDIW